MAKTEENGNHSAVKTPKTLMSDVNYKQTPQTEKDKMTTLVERYQNLDPVRIVELGDKVIKFCTPNLMTLDRVWNLFHAEPVTIEWILNFKENETLFDIGANVGTYGIFASIMKHATQIHTLFIQNGAKHQVNVDAPMQNSVKTNIEAGAR